MTREWRNWLETASALCALICALMVLLYVLGWRSGYEAGQEAQPKGSEVLRNILRKHYESVRPLPTPTICVEVTISSTNTTTRLVDCEDMIKQDSHETGEEK